MHTVAPSLFWCIDLWNHVDARRKTVLGHVVKRERGRGTLVLAASAVGAGGVRCTPWAPRGYMGPCTLRTSSHLTPKTYTQHR
jgi:hypothetical protein